MKGLWRAKSYGESRGSFRKKIPVKYFIKDKIDNDIYEVLQIVE